MVFFSIIGVLYYIKDIDTVKAVKLGVLSGVLMGIATSMVLALVILIIRLSKLYFYERTHKKIIEDSYETYPYASSMKKEGDPQIKHLPEDRIILLMEYDVAFEVALHILRHNQIAIIHKSNKPTGEIYIQQHGKHILLRLSKLTDHTTQIHVPPMVKKENFIALLKEKDFSFLQYQ